MRIREMRAGDLTGVVALAEGLAEAPRWTHEAWSAVLEPGSGPERLALVAEAEDGRLIGFGVAALVAREAEIESIGVDTAWQRKGVGRRLVEAMERALGERGCTAILLEVRASNVAAQSLYRAVGFLASGRRPRYYAGPEEDAVLMRKSVGGGFEGGKGAV